MPMACEQMELRDRLPEWVGARERLTPAEGDAIAAHLAVCPACAAEAALLGRVAERIAAASPVVDVARITDAIPAPRVAPSLVVVDGGSAARTERRTRPRWAARSWVAAAATLLLVAGVTNVVGRLDDASRDPAGVQTAELAFEGVGELSDEALTVLLDEMEALPAAPVAEPREIVGSILEPLETP